MAYKVYVSPSTQERNKGAGNYGTEEENMQTIGAKVAELLCYNGFQVRRNRPDMELKQVVEDSNAFDPDAHVAIHSNAGGGRGCEAYAWLVDDGKGGYKDTPGRRLAQAIYDEVTKITPAKDRGVKQGNWLYEIKHTKAPAALVEVSFHDNANDAAWIKANYNAIAEAITRGICKYFGVTYKSNVVTDKEDDTLKTIVTYYGDADVFAAILVAQKYHCPLMEKSDFQTSGIKADKVIEIGGKPGTDRFDSLKDAAKLV